MTNHEKLPTSEDYDLASPKNNTTINDQSRQIEDTELSFAKEIPSLPWYVRRAKAIDNYLRKNEKTLPTLRAVLIVISCLAFLMIAKNMFLSDHFGDNTNRRITYKSHSGSAHGVKTYVSPFLDIQFENPIPYNEIKTPTIEKVDYIPKLQMTCYLYNKDHLNIIIRDADKVRYELPHEGPFPFPKDVTSVLPEDSDFILELVLQPFNLIIKRKSTEEVIFSLADRFVYTNFYLEVSFVMPTNEIYGLGERISPLQFKDGTYSLFILDRVGQIDEGKPGFNAQGHQSMYLCKEKSDFYHVTLFKNIAAQEVVIKDRKLTWKAIGGVYDFHFFLGESPEDAVRKYHAYIGGWTLPAFWHMGYHQSKWWGYKNVSHLEYVMENFEKAGIPLDVMWSDLDIYEDDQNFNYNNERFPPSETQKIFQKYNKRWITVVQAYIPLQKTNPVWQYNNGDILDYTIKDGKTNEPLIGYEFSGFVHFIDFLNPEASKFWQSMLEFMNSKVPVSGFWLDANEVTNLISRFGDTKDIYFNGIEERKYYKLPFYPGGENLYDLPLVNLDAVHYGGIEEYNVRSLNAFYQSQSTYNYLRGKDGTYFPFVLSRGNMFGIGQYSFHFVPDIHSTWELLRASMGPTLTYQIFGIPVIGADICGFIDEHRVDSELCVRWHQLSVFYTFARNHHAPKNAFDNYQEPYVFNGTTFDSIKQSILLRYSMLKQFYTYFFTQPGNELRVGTIMRPLFFEFHRKSFHDWPLPPYGSKVYEEQFMMSDAIMAAPVLYPGYSNMPVYFPICKWYDLRNGEEIPVRGEYLTIDTNIEDGVPHFLRGGKLIFKQDVTGVRSTEDLNNVFKITAGLTDFVFKGDIKKAEAAGTILDVPNYSEEVIYKQCATENCLMNVTIDCSYGEDEFTVTVSSKSHSTGRTEDPIQINYIHLLGAPKDFKAAAGKFELQDGGEFDFTFDESNKALSIHLPEKITLNNNSQFVFTIKL